MRPKLLEIEGLQSFLDAQTVDFESLGETGLFGIFGPTGSGKSTVLDAITFALYGKVKRAERGTQGIINTNMNTARVSFTFELLKGASRKVYRVERVYQRKKGSDNSCEPKIARLIEITEEGDIPLCDKASEVTKSVEELLGLGHDDFTRAVVLPQNSFQEFLLLDNSKKRDMLERIFYLEEYGKKLWEKLGRKMSFMKSRIDRIEGELSAYSDASEEALKEAEQVMKTAAEDRAKAEKELKNLEARYNEAKEIWQLIRELDYISSREQQHMSLKEAIKQKKLLLEKALKAEGIIGIIQKHAELLLKLNETEEKLKEVEGKIPEAYSNFSDTVEKYECVRKEAQEKQPQMLEFKAKLVNALEIKKEINTLKEKIKQLKALEKELNEQIDQKAGLVDRGVLELRVLNQRKQELRKKADSLKVDPEYRQDIQDGVKLENDIQNLNSNIQELKNRVQGLNEVVQTSEQKYIENGKEIELSGKTIEDLIAEKERLQENTPGDRRQVLQYRDKLQVVCGKYSILVLKKSEIDDTRSKIEKGQSDLRELKEKTNKVEEERIRAGSFHEECKLELERVLGAISQNTAYMLSKNLKEDEPCPVCGSHEHPFPALQASGDEISVLEKKAESAAKALKEAEKALRESERECIASGEQIKALNDQIKQSLKQLEVKTEEYNTLKLNIPEELRELETEKIGQELDKMDSLSLKKLEDIEELEKKQEEYRLLIEKNNQQLSKFRAKENGIASELKVNRKNLADSEESLNNMSRVFKDKHKSYQDFLGLHHIDSALDELKKISENDREISSLQVQMDQLEKLLDDKEIMAGELKDELAALKSKAVKIEADIEGLVKQQEEKQIKLGDIDIEGEISCIDTKLEQYEKLQGDYQESLKSLEGFCNELTAQKGLFENQRKIYSESVDEETSRLETMLKDKGFTDSNEAVESILSQEKRTAFNLEIEEYEQEERNIQAVKSMLVKKLDSRSITGKEWSDISTSYQEMLTFKEECVSRSEVTKSSFIALKSKHEKWAELNEAYSDIANKYGLMEQIQKLLRAERGKDNSFIDFIAEERLRYIAAKASETLGLMTKYRYALELDTEAGFIIRDNTNGGVCRMVTSLSGGEVFLTSLSLALALSEQIQLKGQSPLEFFFLDEGFGTLDSVLLDAVIDSLERLSKKERVIGLISHVPELRNRIARRLIVKPPSSKGEGSRVAIEKA